MLAIAIAATALAIFPMTDRCRSAIMQSGFVPEIESPVVMLMSSNVAEVVCENVVLTGLDVALVSEMQVGACQFEPPEAVVTIARLTLGLPLEAERKLGFAYVVPPVRDAVPRPPDVLIPDPRSLPSNVLATAVGKLIYDALADGSINARAPKWRMPLVQMLVDGTPGTDFDHVYGFLLRTLGGNDERTKIRALAKWTGENLAPREAADVYRAETRYWLNLGDSAMTVDAAKRMERARPDYAVRARRLSALSYATSGELEKAKAEIARSRAECDLPSYERLELLYLEAWIWLQEGDVGAARRNLNSIVDESPRSALARKALSILESIPKED